MGSWLGWTRARRNVHIQHQELSDRTEQRRGARFGELDVAWLDQLGDHDELRVFDWRESGERTDSQIGFILACLQIRNLGRPGFSGHEVTRHAGAFAVAVLHNAYEHGADG